MARVLLSSTTTCSSRRRRATTGPSTIPDGAELVLLSPASTRFVFTDAFPSLGKSAAGQASRSVADVGRDARRMRTARRSSTRRRRTAATATASRARTSASSRSSQRRTSSDATSFLNRPAGVDLRRTQQGRRRTRS
jgi:hypothetical protein